MSCMEVPRESNERGRTATEEEGRSQWSWNGYYHDRPCCLSNLDPSFSSFDTTFTPNSLGWDSKICKATQMFKQKIVTKKRERFSRSHFSHCQCCHTSVPLRAMMYSKFHNKFLDLAYTSTSSLLGKFLMFVGSERVNKC